MALESGDSRFRGNGEDFFIPRLFFTPRTLTSSIPAKAGISLFAEAGRATLAPLRFVICAGGAGIGRFPLSREWKVFLLSRLFFTPRTLTSSIPAKAGISCLLRGNAGGLFCADGASGDSRFRGNGEDFFIPRLFFTPRTLTSSIPAKAGISLFAEAGRATLAPLRFVICADGAGIGRFPLSREWEGFFIPRLFFTPRTLTSSIPAKAGISLFAEAGRATLAPLWFVICAGGAGIGRFPLSREWKGEGFFYSTLIFYPPHSPLPFPRKRESPCLLRRGEQRSRRFGL